MSAISDLRRGAALLLCLLLLLCGGCSRVQSFRFTYLDLFDTVTTVTVQSASREEAAAIAGFVHDELLECHRLFDIYETYEGFSNLCSVNLAAGGAPVAVDGRILDLLEFAQEMGLASGGKMNVCMGSVLSLWHDARRAAEAALAALPDAEALAAAREHISHEALRIDRAAGTVCLTDADARLDVGAVAKGWAVQHVCELLRERGCSGVLISAGGNVASVGPKSDGRSWKVALEDPLTGGELLLLSLSDGAAVTSGSYQRYFTVDGVRYHHIIDPETVYPADRYIMVTVVCADSAAADALSTALFLLPQAEGQALAETFAAEALWFYEDGTVVSSPGFSSFVA